VKKRDDLAIILSHFNWCGYRRPDQNLNRFLRQMQSLNIPVYGAEASLTGEYLTQGNPNWVHIKAKRENILFQKEALLNIAEKIVPAKYTKIAWLDHDILFMNPDWYDELSTALDTLNLVQVFESCIWTDSRGVAGSKYKSILSFSPITVELVTDKSLGTEKLITSGYGYAAPRTLWSKGGGLYPYNFIGGGDTAILHAVASPDLTPGAAKISYLQNAPDFYPHLIWRQLFHRFVNKKTGAIKGDIYHEYHGTVLGRKYVTRSIINMTHDFNVKKHIKLAENGLLELIDPPWGYQFSIENYFMQRREDDFEDISIPIK
jgi:hypothetical protein